MSEPQAFTKSLVLRTPDWTQTTKKMKFGSSQVSPELHPPDAPTTKGHIEILETIDILVETSVNSFGSLARIERLNLANAERDHKMMVESNRENRVGRNDPCPCGSEKKYKKCCLVAPNLNALT